MPKWKVKFHPYFFKDLDKLSNKDIEIFERKKKKIKDSPLRHKHLSGRENCYREPITHNIRLVYYIKDDIIWMLIIGKHDKTYSEYLKRLHSLKTRHGFI